MESKKIHNCGFCDNSNVLKKCGKAHTRCKQTRFCNKTCETKERNSEVTANENPGDESLKNAAESEMKRLAKKERKIQQNINFAMNRPGDVVLTQDNIRILQIMTSSTSFSGARNGQRPQSTSKSRRWDSKSKLIIWC